MSFGVRRLNVPDAETYRALRLEGLQLSPANFGSSLADEEDQPLDFFAGRISRHAVFGLFETEQMVGTASYFREALHNTDHRGHLVGVYLAPKARGRGGADLLMEAVIAEARQHILQLHLTVAQDNEAARRLYERHGFVIYGEDPRGLRVDGVFHDDYLMVLRLDEGSGK